ncbi:MAG: hypothetical protein ABW221_16860 [Vicinamibacteria bacterium]
MEDDAGAAAYQPRPPMWTAAVKPRSPLERALTIAVALVATLFAVFCVVYFGEPFVLASHAEATVVTVSAVEALSQGEHTAPRYRVLLPDGSSERLHTPSVLQVGDRLTAMVSRGRITGRVFVGPPHSTPFRGAGTP